jgi:hypothetical protein
MLKIPPLLLATAVVVATGTNVFGMPQKASSAPDTSFSLFFDPGAAALSKEGRKIIAIAAKRFVATHSLHPAAHIVVTSETDDQDNASLSVERLKAVSNQLERDGVQKKFVSTDQQTSIHAKPVRLLEWLDRRVSISIQDNPVSEQIVG